MDSKEELNADGPQNNTATENSDGGTTMAMQKKRARRVSFAENTSIRFFEVDDDSKESPSTDTAKFGDHSVNQSELKDFEGEDDEDDEDVMEMRRSFLRPIGSPSPGSSSIRSDSSIDEDNFYGPVSADFIRPGRLSDSDAFVDNDDVTMDSTAFSMHYNSLARSESGVDLKTPTTGKLFFEEKTPTNGNTGSPMSFTLGKKPIPKSSMPVTKVSGSHDSNDMSLVGDKPNKYDFEKLPPGLDAILAEGRNLLSDSVSDDIIASKSPQRIQSEILASTDHGDNLVNGLVSVDIGELAEENERLQTFFKDLSAQKFSSTKFPATSSTADYRPNMSPYQLMNSESKTPLVAATSPVKGHKIIPVIASPSKLLDTPLLVQPGSYLRNESIDHHAGDTSIQKSISKLESLGKSPFYSAFSAKVDSSTIKLLDFSKSPNLNNFLEGNRHVSKINLMQDSVTEEKIARVHHSKEKIYALGMHGNGYETPKRISGEDRFEESLGHLMSQKLRNLSTDQSEYRGAAASPPKVTWTGNNMKHSFLTSNRSSEDALMTETDSLLAEIKSGERGQDSVAPTKFVSSPPRILGKGSVSPGSQSSKHEDLLHQNQFKQLSEFDQGRGSTPERNPLNANLSTATANKNAVAVEMKGELSSSIVEGSRLKNLIETKPTDGIREVDNDSETEVVGIMDNFVTPDNEKTMQVMLPKIRDVSNQINQNISRFEDFLPGGESNVVTPSVCQNLDEPRLLVSYQNPVELPAASPSRKERDNEHVSSTPSLKSIQLSGKLEKNSANKRSVELLLRDTQHIAEMTIMQRSPKLQKIGICDPATLLYPNGGSKGTTVTGHERKCWTDIYIKLSEDMKQLISLSADKLNFKMIDVLEDLLVYRKRLQMYEMLRSAAQNTSALHDLQHDIIAETNPLLYQIVSEKAKLQLKHVKRERLLKRLQLLSSKIQEARRSKTNISSQTLKARTSNVLVDAVSDRSLSDNFQKDHEAKEALDRKILDLKKTFHVRCGTKSEPNCKDTIALVNKHLMKRAQRRFIRLDMQMWVVHSVGSANGQHNIVLNYLDLILQSIKVIIGPTSSATTSFKLNEANIIKSFPNLDVCTAFAFVFNVVTTQKYVGAKILVQETQVTSSLLGSLLDVVEEVQSARMEFQNLTQSSFFSPSVEQLDLMLCFFNFNTGRKVILTLDMSCLKRGIYPSDAIPLQLASPVDRQKCSLSEPIIGEIRDAVKGVRTGYRRIFRLCSCVSQVIQTLKS